ncbi:unnamed protein product [Choristocarpus tenellus]
MYMSLPTSPLSHLGVDSGGPATSSRKGRSPPAPRFHGRGDGSRSGERGRTVGLHTSPLLTPERVLAEVSLDDDPLPWDKSLSSGGELFYAPVMRWQVAALQESLGLSRVKCPDGLDAACNIEKGGRIANAAYVGDRVRLLRLSYLDLPNMQAADNSYCIVLLRDPAKQNELDIHRGVYWKFSANEISNTTVCS